MTAPSPTTPVAAAYAPNRIVRAYRLMPGQMRMTTPNAIDRTPLSPSAQRNLFSCVHAIFSVRSMIESIEDLQVVLTSRLSRSEVRARIGERADLMRKR
jgi:hypothetical protein